jgi:transcription initiation factor TFIID TATA-box-binding protein
MTITDRPDHHESNNNIDYQINNIVATAKVDIIEKLDLVKIVQKLDNAEYYPERFPGIIFRQDNPRATFLIFSSGKMVITGLESIQYAEKVVSKLLKKIRKFIIKSSEPVIKVQNIVANGDLHKTLNLNKAILTMESVMYEPEVFPGLIYNMKNPRAVFLLFSTGSFVCTGIKEKEMLKRAILKLKKEIDDMDVSNEEIVKEEFELTFI